MQWPVDDEGIVRQIIFPNEGWPRFTNDPADEGGPTKGGITLPALSAFRGKTCTVTDLQALEEPEAIALYRRNYIVAPGFDFLSNIRVRTAAVDMAVLFGSGRTADTLANSVGLMGVSRVTDVIASQVNAADPRAIILALSKARISHHADVVVAKPEELKFLPGWINRAFEFPW